MNNAAAVTMFLSLAVLALLPGCTTIPPEYKEIIIATNNGAKFRAKEPLQDGNVVQWQGAVDSKGFATGRGTHITINENGEKIAEYNAQFLRGLESEGSYELLQYSGAQLYSKRSGANDLQGNDHGRTDWTYYTATNGGDQVSKYTNFSHGIKSGRSVIYCKDGTKEITDYIDGKIDDWCKILPDGTEERDHILDRNRQMRQSYEEFKTRVAEEEADRRASRNQAMLSGLATGLANIAAETSSSSSSTSSPSYSSNTGDSNSEAWLTSKKSRVEGTASAPVVDRRGISHGSVYIQYGSALECKTLDEAQANADRIARGNAKVWNDKYDREDEQRALRGR